MQTEKEIRENLSDAGCSEKETESILKCIGADNMREAEKQISLCRKRELQKVHESQKRIDRLDYLVWEMNKGRHGT
ncbi:MAG: hypothetical protein ACI4D6_10820 [Chordicoccus sp.]